MMMKIILLNVSLFLCLSVFSQNKTTTKENLPSVKFNATELSINKIILDPLSKSVIDDLILQRGKDGGMYRVAKSLPLDATIFNSGTIDYLSNGGQLWRLSIKSAEAKSTVLLFDWFNLPKDAEMYVYCEKTDMVWGPYTHESNLSGEEYAIGIIPADEVFIEYYENNNFTKSEKAPFKISAFDYFFRGEDLYFNVKDFNEAKPAGSCNVNINCPEGTNWQIHKKGICRIYIGGGYCTGTLVNNTSQDGTPYVLFADHCGGTSSTSVFNQCIYYFYYESTGCSNTPLATQRNFTGSTRIARGDERSGTDFLMVKLTNATPTQIMNANLVYNGWDRTGTASPNGVCIHHPAGDIKKISKYTQTLTNHNFTSVTNSAWRVIWVQTETNWGVTEPGSSGSPLFNNNGLVVGTLSGGVSSCTASASNKYDLYGKFNYHWNNSANGSTNDNKLQPWLDPNNTNATTCPLYDPNNTTSRANFTANPTTVNVGGTVQFTDASTIVGAEQSRFWSFQGGNPSTSTALNPTVIYTTTGTYSVSLTINTTGGNHTETKTGYITVQGNSPLTSFSYDFELCLNFTTSFSPCTTYEGNNVTTGGFNATDFTNESGSWAFIAMNPSACTPSMVSNSGWQAHGGSKYAAAAWKSNNQANNSWFILPRILVEGNTTFSFWAKSIASEYPESFKIMVSTTNNTAPGSFTQIPSSTGTSSVSNVPATWTKYTYSLSSYAGQNIYLAIVCTSVDKYMFAIDDIEVKVETSDILEEQLINIMVYPNPNDGNFHIVAPVHSEIRIFDIMGKNIESFKTISEISDIHLNQPAGIYFIEIQNNDGIKVEKIVISE